MAASSLPIVAIKGSDPILVNDQATKSLDELVGDHVRSEVVDQFSGDDYELDDVIIAAKSVSMFGDRIIVARHAARFAAADIGVLIDYLADPNPTSTVLLVWEKPLSSGATAKPFAKKLADAIAGCGGEVISCNVSAKEKSSFIASAFADAGIDVDRDVVATISARIGDDVSRTLGIVRSVSSLNVEGSLSASDIAPFLGEQGSAPPWELTDAIDSGNIAQALERTQALVADRHPLAVMSTLTTHFLRIGALDGAHVSSDKQAAELLDIKGSTFPAKKAMAQSRRLGHQKIVSAISLLADADVELRGKSAVPPEITMMILVGRLAALSSR